MRAGHPSVLSMSRPLGTGDSDADDSGTDDQQETNDARAQRFHVDLTGNRFRELETARVEERKAAIRDGLIADPNKRTTLEDAINFRGTCKDMCPEFEREEREYKKNVHPLEQLEGQPGRIDPAKAVTIYHRSAAGIEQPLPSDVRDPPTLKRTLDYLFHDVINTPDPALVATDPTARSPLACLRYTHHFIRDRSRGIRQDFTYQAHWGKREAIECHERIARFHILSMHELADAMAGEMEFLKQEAEQLNKTLVTLTHLYDDERMAGHFCPNEPEFRAYQLLSHLYDNEIASSVMILPYDIFSHPLVQLAFDFRALAQRNFDTQKVGSKSNSEISLNFYSRFFKLAKRQDVPFLLACLAQHKFADVRRAAMRALSRSYPRAKADEVIAVDTRGHKVEKYMSLDMLAKLLGCQSEEEAAAVADSLDFTLVFPEEGSTHTADVPIGVVINVIERGNDNADAPHAETPEAIQAKSHGRSYRDIIDNGYAAERELVKHRPAVLATPERSGRPTLPDGGASLASRLPNGFGVARQLSAETFGQSAATARPILNPEAPYLQPAAAPSHPETRTAPSFALIPPTPSVSSVSRVSTPATTNANEVPFTSSQSSVMPTFAPKQVAGSTAAVRPVPKLNVAAILPKIGGQLFGDTIYRYSTIVAKAAIQDEDRARLEAQQQQSRAQRESRIIALTESVYAEITSGLIDQNLAIAYADERCRRGVESKVFQYWRWRANMSKSRRQERERHRCLFRHQAKDMSLGLSQVAANPATLSETLQRSVTRRGLSDQVDQEDWDMSLQDSVQTIARRKNILEEGTFASVLGNHICNVPQGSNDPDEEDENEVLHAVLSATDSPSGNWLKMKFKVDSEPSHDAKFHGLSRDGVIDIINQAKSDSVLPDGLCIALFEYGGASPEGSNDRERFDRLISSLPRRPDYHMGLLVLSWTSEPTKDILRTLNFGAAKEHFTWAHLINMHDDASDEALDKGLDVALPALQRTERVTLDLEDLVSRLFEAWHEMVSVSSLVLSQLPQADYHAYAQVARRLLGGLGELEASVTNDFAADLGIDLSHDKVDLPAFNDDIPTEDDLVLALQKYASDMPLRDSDNGLEALARGPDGLSTADYAGKVIQRSAEALRDHLSRVQVTVREVDARERFEDLSADLVAEYRSSVQEHSGEIAGLAKAVRPVETVLRDQTSRSASDQAHRTAVLEPSLDAVANTAADSLALTANQRKRAHEEENGSADETAGDSRIAKLRRAIAKANEAIKRVSDVAV